MEFVETSSIVKQIRHVKIKPQNVIMSCAKSKSLSHTGGMFSLSKLLVPTLNFKAYHFNSYDW